MGLCQRRWTYREGYIIKTELDTQAGLTRFISSRIVLFLNPHTILLSFV